MACTSVHPSLRKLNEETKEHLERRAAAERESAVLRERAGALERRVGELQSECAAITTRCSEAETARATTAEQLSVALSERKMMDGMLGRADQTIAELRAERDTLLQRNDSLSSECAKQQQARIEADHARAQRESELGVSRAERRLADDKGEALAAQLKASEERAAANEARVLALEANLQEVLNERHGLQERVAVAHAERRLLDETADKLAAQVDAERVASTERLSTAEAKVRVASEAKEAAETERAAVQTQLAVATAERRLAQEASDERQQKYSDERAVRERAEVANLELERRLRVAEGSALAASGQCASLEAQRSSLSERFAHAAAHVRVLQSERKAAEDELARREAHSMQLDLSSADRYVARYEGLGEWSTGISTGEATQYRARA